MNSVERVKAICKQRRIPISKLERDLGYANGYIGQLRKGVFPSDRLMEIAKYLSLSAKYLSDGEDEQKENSPSQIELTEGEIELVKIFRLIPEEKQRAFLEMGRVFADSLKKD